MTESSLDYLFHPRSIAVIGVSADLARHSIGRTYIKALIDFGFGGKIYPVNPSGGEIFGLEIYRSLADIPDQVDYVILVVPARHTPQLVADCAARGVKAIHFFTSGFSEIEDESGKELEKEIVTSARRFGIRILGPNCMGLYCPETGLTFSIAFPGQDSFPRQGGPLAFISQSGGNAIYCVNEAVSRGVCFSKAISYGNGADLNESDFLEYFAHDPETRIISAYLEGVRDGARFARTLRMAAGLKPVVICKAGTTEAGTRAAASHTGSLAGSQAVWRSVLKQAGAIQVDSIEEIIDTVLLFLRMPAPEGRRVAVVGSGGGPSVLAADDCSNAGLALPTLPADVRVKLREMYGSEAGYIFRNPVDIVMRSEILPAAIKMIADCRDIDLLIFQIAFDNWSLIGKKDIVDPAVESLVKLRDTLSKPVAVVLHCQATDQARQLASEAQKTLWQAGFAVYPSMKRAATAIDRVLRYHGSHAEGGPG